MNNEWSFVRRLHETGRRAVDMWLAETLDAVGGQPLDRRLVGPRPSEGRPANRPISDEAGAPLNSPRRSREIYCRPH